MVAAGAHPKDRGRDRNELGAVWRVLPIAAAALALGVSFVNLPAIAGQLGWNEDVAARYVIGDTLALGHGHLFTTQLSYSVVDALTRWLPFHRVFWMTYPYVSMLAALCVLAWTVSRVAGGNAAWLALGLAVAASPAVLLSEAAQAFHGFAYIGAITIGALLVGAALKLRSLRPWLVAIIVVGVAGVAATDAVLVVIGVIPAAIALAATSLRHAQWRTTARRGGVILIATAILIAATTAVLYAIGFRNFIPGGTHRSIASLSGLLAHGKAVVAALLDLGNGLPYSSMVVTPWHVILAAAILLGEIAAVVAVAIRAWRHSEDPATTIHVTYWLSSSALLLASFVAADIVEGDFGLDAADRLVANVRFLVPLAFTVVALLPLWPRGVWARRGAAAFVAAVAMWNSYGVIGATSASAFHLQGATPLPALLSVLENNHLSRGYAGYGEASTLTWKSNARVVVAPISQDANCGLRANSGQLCALAQNSLAQWFVPQGAASTFVVVDPANNYLRQQPSVATFGSPSQTLHSGDISVYVYTYDVAARFASVCAGRADHRC